MFYGREKELQKLSRRYAGEKSECVVVYGRRRVGKTALTKEFCRGKSVIYFSALNANSFDNLEELSRVISEYRLSTPEGTDCVIYPSYADAFRSVEHISSSKRIIFVIDNYQYLLKAEESVAARIWNMVKRPRDENKLFHILCGSPQCFMENRVLGYESSLHGLITVKIKLEPLTYRESALMTPGLPTERLAQIYGITGGIPHYINKLDVRGKVDTALMRNVFDTSSYLFEEPENLLKQDLREPAMYNSILTAMAHGAARLGEISSGVGIESGKCAKYLQVLLDLGIVEKETPITEKPGRKTIYVIKDQYFRFWYRFVPRNMSAIVLGKMGRIYNRAVRTHKDEYMQQTFEQMCRDYLMKYADLPISITEVGRWWGTDRDSKKEVSIDIVGRSIDVDEYIVGSCLYDDRPAGIKDLVKLKYNAGVFGKGNKFHYYLFSRSGFTNELIECEMQGAVRLLTLRDLY